MKKIQRTVKRLLQIPYSKTDHNDIMLQQIKAAGPFTNINKQKNEISFLYNNKHTVFARLWPHSDAMVLEQVLTREEYRTVTDFFKINFPATDKLSIIDAGANVGYSSVFFLHEFPAATIACVEPDGRNVAMLQKNISSFISSKQARIFQNGLMSQAGRNIVTNKEFRDGKDWSVSVTETDKESELKSITVEEIRKQMGWEEVDILKIDIEGAERFVFDDAANLDYLQKVKTVAVEIHDEFNIRDTVYRQLKKYDFAIFNFAETTFGISKRLLQS